MADGLLAFKRFDLAAGAVILRRDLRVDVKFQRFPGKNNGAGITGLDYEVSVDGGPVQKGTTDNNGLVTLRMPAGGTAQLKILGSEYEVKIRPGAMEPAIDILGQQRRLRHLGYQIGHDGADGTGVDGAFSYHTERSILDFQADVGIRLDAQVGSTTRDRLTNAVGE